MSPKHGQVSTAKTPSGGESTRKVLSLLLAFSEQEPVKTVPELATHLEVPVSSAYRYVGLLREFGLLEEAEFGGYRVSLRALDMARAARSGAAGLSAIAHPVLVELSRQTGETALVIRRIGQAVMAVDIEESFNPVRLTFERGNLMPLNRGSAARLLLASLSDREREAYYSSLRSLEDTPELPTAAELAEVAEQGWTQSFGQVSEGIWGCAAAITVGRRVIAALSVAGPLYRLDEDKRAEIVTAVREHAGQINARVADAEF
jgi:DNA-binding IclR family transcriptional regulator